MKIAIVTGASSGLGREMVLQLGDRYGKLGEIWVIARREERLVELKGRVPVPLRILPLDLTKEAALYRLRKELEKRNPEAAFRIGGL